MRAVPKGQGRWVITGLAVVLVTLLGGIAVLAATLTGSDAPAVAHERPRPPLPQGSERRGREGAEESAVAMATELQAVPLRSGGTCPEDRLDVSWNGPDDQYRRGAHVSPVGPAPDRDTTRVNGIVRCRRSEFAYAGFTARYEDGRWQINIVPTFDETEGDVPTTPDAGNAGGPGAGPGTTEPADGSGDGTGVGTTTTTEPAPPAVPAEVPDIGAGAPGLVPGESPVDATTLGQDSPWIGLWGEEIEPLATYQPQQVCSPSAKPGTVGFHDLVLRTYPDSGDFGISRDCAQGGRSEHKEGRAWDWAVDVNDPTQKQHAAEVIGWLLATDEYRHQFAMARRLGVMYVIYNGHIWSAYDAAAGWRPYDGPNAHTDHVHISFDIDGGQGATSFWRIDILDRFGLGQFGPATILPEYDGPLAYGEPPQLTAADRRPPRTDDEDPARPSPAAPTPPVTPSPAPGGGGTGGGGNGTGGSGSSPLPTAPPSPVPLPPLPPVTVPPVTIPPLPTIPGLPACPPGTPPLPLPTDCLLPDSARTEAESAGPTERSPMLLVSLSLASLAAIGWHYRRTNRPAVSPEADAHQ